MTVFILRLPLAVFSFSEKLSGVALASKVIIISHYSYLCTFFFFLQENKNANLTFATGERARSSQIWNEREAFDCFGELKLPI